MNAGSMFLFVAMILALALPVGARAGSPSGATPHSCEPSNVTATFQGVTIRYSCFGGSGFTRSQKTLDGGQISGYAAGISSHGSWTPAMSIWFSADPSCRFATGTTMQLRNPCLLISDNDPDTLPNQAFGFVSRCFPKGGKVYTLAACVLIHRTPAADLTSGSITFTRWPSPPPLRGFGVVAFRFSSDAKVTGFYTKIVGGDMPITTEVAVPLAGSATMKVAYWTPR